MRQVSFEDLGMLNKPYNEEFVKVFEEIVKSGYFILGRHVTSFERAFADFCGTKYAVGVASGLDALTLSLLSLELPKGSEVIVPSHTYIATILAVINAGLQPVLTEPDLKTYNIDPQELEKKLTNKTRVIIAVHMYGKMCKMEAIQELISGRNITIIEDCAQAHGSCRGGKKAGAWGIMGAFSFYPTKNLGALGDGGCITTSGSEIDEKLKAMRNYGSQKKYYNDYIGINSRLDEIQAAFLEIKLKNLAKVIDHKRKLASIYQEQLSERFIKPVQEEDSYDTFHLYPVRHNRRDELRVYLEKNGIKTDIHYPIPPHLQRAYQGYFAGEKFKKTEEIHNTILSLPISAAKTEEEIRYVCEVMNGYKD